MKTFQHDLHIKDGPLFNDNKLVIPATLRSSFSASRHETHSGQLGTKALAETIWWPHLERKIYHSARNCSDCAKTES